MSFFCIYLNDYNRVLTMGFGDSCWGFVLSSLTHSFALVTIGDLVKGVLMVCPILAVRGNARDHCFRIMRLCLELVTENSA